TRQTRSKRDWSTDVCSSDLVLKEGKRLGYKNAIVTSDSRLSTEAFIKQFNLNDYVDFVIAGGDSEYSKPDVNVLDSIVEAGYEYKDIVVVGDNYTDTRLGIKNGDRKSVE